MKSPYDVIAELRKLLAEATAGFTPDPGTSDLYDEQPINVRATLGWHRRATRALWDRDSYLQAEQAKPEERIAEWRPSGNDMWSDTEKS
jgi:hypothetical protein